MMFRVVVFFMVSMTLFGCNEDIPKTEYFPLQEGVTWHYQVTRQLVGSQETLRSYHVENRGEAKLTNEYAEDPVYIRHTSDGTDYYILQDDTGTYRIAERTLIEYKPRFENDIVRILPNLADLEVGRSWSVVTKPYTLHRNSSSSLPDPSEQKINMLFEISSVNDTVTMASGTFDNCLRIEGTAILSLYVDPRVGYQDIKITQTEWYAPGVGLVKLLREEPLDMPLFKGGSILFELTEFDP